MKAGDLKFTAYKAGYADNILICAAVVPRRRETIQLGGSLVVYRHLSDLYCSRSLINRIS